MPRKRETRWIYYRNVSSCGGSWSWAMLPLWMSREKAIDGQILEDFILDNFAPTYPSEMYHRTEWKLKTPPVAELRKERERAKEEIRRAKDRLAAIEHDITIVEGR